MNQQEVNVLIQSEMNMLEERLKSLGCNTEIGCLAGKKHFQEHADKWASDIHNLKSYTKENDKENKVVRQKLSEVTIMLHDVIKDLSNLLKNYSSVEKRVDRFDVKLWGVVVIILTLCIGTLGSSYLVFNSIGDRVYGMIKKELVELNNNQGG